MSLDSTKCHRWRSPACDIASVYSRSRSSSPGGGDERRTSGSRPAAIWRGREAGSPGRNPAASACACAVRCPALLRPHRRDGWLRPGESVPVGGRPGNAKGSPRRRFAAAPAGNRGESGPGAGRVHRFARGLLFGSTARQCQLNVWLASDIKMRRFVRFRGRTPSWRSSSLIRRLSVEVRMPSARAAAARAAQRTGDRRRAA